MRVRRIQIDLDDCGVVIQTNTTLYDEHGATTLIVVDPPGFVSDLDPHDALDHALAVEQPIPVQLPLAWESYLSADVPSAIETPIPVRSDRPR